MSFTIRRVREEKKPSELRQYGKSISRLIRSAFQFHQHFEHAKEIQNKKIQRERTLKRTVAILLSTLLVLLLIIGTLHALVRLKTIALGAISIAGATVASDSNGFTNIVLLGEGDNDHAGIDLTDTIMIASIDPKKTKSVVLLSIPRDTYVLTTEKMGKDRMNSLYRNYKHALIRTGMKEQEASAESLRQLTTEIGALLGITIHGAIKVNFSGFEQAIDALGGIDIDVPDDIIDTQYPKPDYTYETFQIAKGPQHLDGATALKYARTRHSTSDFARSARQQQIIAATAKKLKEGGMIKNAGTLTELFSIIAKNVESTFATRELLGLADMGKSIDTRHIISMQINDQNGLFEGAIGPGGFLYAPPRDQFDGASVLLPVSLPEFPVTWKQIQALTSLLLTKREAFLQPATVTILNAGAKEGLARKLGGELYRYGFNVLNTRNYGPKGSPIFQESFIAMNPVLQAAETDQSKALRDHAGISSSLLASILKIPMGSTPDATPFEKDAANIVIVLGKDFQYTPLQDLIK